jgi:hypothetical protein
MNSDKQTNPVITILPDWKRGLKHGAIAGLFTFLSISCLIYFLSTISLSSFQPSWTRQNGVSSLTFATPIFLLFFFRGSLIKFEKKGRF